ncbi:MAG: putative membrane protein [Saprospiraceae bacterium]|jgi:uncharacterized membrane protein
MDKKHKMSGYLWAAGGLLITVCALIFPAEISFYAVMGISLLLNSIVVIYSYLKYKEIDVEKA